MMPSRQLLIRKAVLALADGPMLADLLLDAPRIVAIRRDLDAPDAARFDATGLTLGPGFVDIHVHGGGGRSFFSSDPGNIAAYSDWAPRNGVTSFLVSTLGRDPGETETNLEALSVSVGRATGAEPLGFHLEGPFINPARRGAFPPEMLRPPSVEEFGRYQDAGRGLVRQVTFAPELAGALDLAHAIAASGAVPAIGHTDATAHEAEAGFEAGARHVTHLFNAMRPLHQREGGPVAASLLWDDVTCELICDGTHIAQEVLRLAYRILGAARTVVVTDNLQLAGMQQQSGTFAGHPVDVSGAAAVRADGTIVGSIATMDQHFRNAVAFLGVDLPTAFRLCSSNPARVVGEHARKGGLAPGMDADLVLLDADLAVVATVCRGEVAFNADPARLAGPGASSHHP